MIILNKILYFYIKINYNIKLYKNNYYKHNNNYYIINNTHIYIYIPK